MSCEGVESPARTSWIDSAEMMQNVESRSHMFGYLGLRDFLRFDTLKCHRNSYRSQFCHMYERITRDQVELSNQLDGGESE